MLYSGQGRRSFLCLMRRFWPYPYSAYRALRRPALTLAEFQIAPVRLRALPATLFMGDPEVMEQALLGDDELAVFGHDALALQRPCHSHRPARSTRPPCVKIFPEATCRLWWR